MTKIACRECGTTIDRLRGNHLRCNKCYWITARVAGRAHSAVFRAVHRGELPDLKVAVIACVDCGARANRYDHRDYSKPLEVEPVCNPCNLKRGPAVPFGIAA